MSPLRVLAVSDEVDESLDADRLRRIGPGLVVSCGDLPFDYLEFIVTMANVPLVFVPGNHDPDVSGRPRRSGPFSPSTVVTGQAAGPILLPARLTPGTRGPLGAMNAHGLVIRAAGLRIGGLGGSMRYREGPNQYTEKQMARTARRLIRRAKRGRVRRPFLDLLLTHAPPAGLGDEDDQAHRGFHAFHDLVRKVQPRLLVHGHVHPYGRPRPDRFLGNTLVVNAVPSRVLLLEQ
jgi:calcineurin-like phosphoesterase family protein